jgi:poly-gamma-glutamate capsule biosynthesis protein CapA/YwtB (metallophosphatase superfamily)
LILSGQYKFLKRIIYSVAVLFILILQIYSEEFSSDTSFIKIIFAGDIMGHDAQIVGAYNPETKKYDYESTFRYVKPYIENADIAVGNLEVTFAGPPFKGYPRFSSPDDLAVKAESAGFDILVNANNHALDRGKSGFLRTLDLLDSLNIIHTGTFRNSEERKLNYPLIFEKNNIRIALLNYTYGTNSLKADTPCIVNIIDTALIRQDLEKAKSAEPDYVVVIMHWGIEYERQENEFQKKLAGFMLDKGADAVIGSHPHVIQPVEIYYPNESDSADINIIVYSLGNFVSNQREQYRDGGIIFELMLAKSSSGTGIHDYRYLPAWVYKEYNKGDINFYIIPVMLYYENESFFNFSDHDKYKINRFYNDTKGLLKNISESQFFNNFKIDTEDYLK